MTNAIKRLFSVILNFILFSIVALILWLASFVLIFMVSAIAYLIFNIELPVDILAAISAVLCAIIAFFKFIEAITCGEDLNEINSSMMDTIGKYSEYEDEAKRVENDRMINSMLRKHK